jgi:hypothetical protein
MNLQSVTLSCRGSGEAWRSAAARTSLDRGRAPSDRHQVTTTRVPLKRLSATFSARSRQQTTSKKEVDSCHSWVTRSCQRRVDDTWHDFKGGKPVLYVRAGNSTIEVEGPALVKYVREHWLHE